MASAINVGSINLPKMMRHLSHRTSQVRDLVFVRDAIYNKDYKKYPANATSGTELAGPPVNFGYETTSTTGASFTKEQDSGSVTHRYVSSPEIVLPGLKMLQSPITSRSGNLERGGHRVSGACTFYAPSLDYIKTLDNFKNTKAFSELESYDKLYDIERIIINPANFSGTTNLKNYTFADATAGYEIDRLQFKIKTSGTLDYVMLSGKTGDSITATLKWDGNLALSSSAWITIDLPVRSPETDDTTTVYKDGVAYTFTATITDEFDTDKFHGENSIDDSELSSLIISLSSSASVELRDIYLYKEAEWRVQSIKEYRDEYMQIAAQRVRGERTSRRRAYG